MDRVTLYRMISMRTGIPAYVAKVVVEEMEEEIVSALLRGEAVYFRGFGSFSVRMAKGRKHCNLPNKKECESEDHYAPHFKPSKKFIKQMADEKKIPNREH